MSDRGKNKRPYTAQDDAVIRARYRRGAVAGIAADLGRSVGSIWQRASRLGLRLRNDDPHYGPEFQARVLELHAGRRGTSEIGRALSCSPQTVHAILRRHGLTTWGRASNAARESARRNMRARLARGEKPVDARWRDRSPALKYGLPPISAQALQVLLSLLDGPKTKRQICEATGRPWRGVKRSLRTHHGGTFTCNLAKLGLVKCTARGLGPGSGKGRGKVYHYSLTPRALDLLAARKAVS